MASASGPQATPRGPWCSRLPARCQRSAKPCRSQDTSSHLFGDDSMPVQASMRQNNVPESLLVSCRVVLIALKTYAGGCGSSNQLYTAGMMCDIFLDAGAEPGRGQAGSGPVPAHRGRARRHCPWRLQPALWCPPARHRAGGPLVFRWPPLQLRMLQRWLCKENIWGPMA